MSELKTEILCPEHWEGESLTCMMGPIQQGEHVWMEFTLQKYGQLEGMFEVENKIHVHDESRGYRQRIQIKPLD